MTFKIRAEGLCRESWVKRCVCEGSLCSSLVTGAAAWPGSTNVLLWYPCLLFLLSLTSSPLCWWILFWSKVFSHSLIECEVSFLDHCTHSVSEYYRRKSVNIFKLLIYIKIRWNIYFLNLLHFHLCVILLSFSLRSGFHFKCERQAAGSRSLYIIGYSLYVSWLQ